MTAEKDRRRRKENKKGKRKGEEKDGNSG